MHHETKLMSTQKLKLILRKIDWIVRYLSLFFFQILNIYGKMEHKMLHNAPSSDLSPIILFWKKSIKIDHVSWIDTELIWNLIFPTESLIVSYSSLLTSPPHFNRAVIMSTLQRLQRKLAKLESGGKVSESSSDTANQLAHVYTAYPVTVEGRAADASTAASTR